MKTLALATWMLVATAQAQVPPPGYQIPPTAQQAIPPAPTPAPTAAPVVGMNVDPAPAQTQTQPSFQPMPMPMPMPVQNQPSSPPALTPEDMQKRLQEMNNMRGGYQPSQPTTTRGRVNSPGQPAESVPQKSEIFKVLPVSERAPELKAVLRTSVGDITIRLDRLNAPHTVTYFTGLAKGEIDFTDIKTSKPVKRPFYNGLIFHRVVKGTLIQTGDPFGNGRGNSGQTIQDELKTTMKFDRPGLVAMAPMRDNAGTGLSKATNSSQFFITLREMPEWNGQYTIFGEVEDGLDVVQKIANAKVGPTERPIKRIYLVAVDIIEAGK